MITLQGPRFWATLVLAAGFFFAYSFSRTDESPSPSTDDNGTSLPDHPHTFASGSRIQSLFSDAQSNTSDGPDAQFATSNHREHNVPRAPQPEDRFAPPIAPVQPVGMRPVSLASLPRTKEPDSAGHHAATSSGQSFAARNLAAQHSAARNAETQNFTAQNFTAQNMIGAVPETGEDIPDLKELELNQVAAQIPDWARRPSQLDDLISTGPSSQARVVIPPNMKAFPTWIDHAAGTVPSRGQSATIDRSEKVARRDSPFERSASYGGTDSQAAYSETDVSQRFPKQRLGDSWEERLSSLSPNRLQSDAQTQFAQNERLDRSPSGSFTSNAPSHFAGDSVALVPELASKTATKMPLGSTASGAMNSRGKTSTYSAVLSERSTIPSFSGLSAETQIADRKRHFLFQPGYQPGEPPDR